MASNTTNYGLIKPDANEYYNVSVQNENMDKIDEELFAKSSKSTLTTVTLPASGWTGDDAPYRQTVGVEGVTETSVNEYQPTDDATNSEWLAFQAASIRATQTAGSITFLAYGEMPEIDIPVLVVIRGDL